MRQPWDSPQHGRGAQCATRVTPNGGRRSPTAPVSYTATCKRSSYSPDWSSVTRLAVRRSGHSNTELDWTSLIHSRSQEPLLARLDQCHTRLTISSRYSTTMETRHRGGELTFSVAVRGAAIAAFYERIVGLAHGAHLPTRPRDAFEKLISLERVDRFTSGLLCSMSPFNKFHI